jgi:hypothetical protein
MYADPLGVLNDWDGIGFCSVLIAAVVKFSGGGGASCCCGGGGPNAETSLVDDDDLRVATDRSISIDSRLGVLLVESVFELY